MSKTIYIETTIPSFYHTLRSNDESKVRMKWTREWWDRYADVFRLTSSVAVASFDGIDYLLTWNCKHLANIKKIGHIRKVNSDLGLLTPELTTPLNFLGGEDEHER